MSAIAPLPEAGRPFVQFELRAVEDRTASIKSGHYVARDAEWIHITPPGGNLVVDREITAQDRERFAREYEHWKKGLEPPVDGTPIHAWPVASPAQVEMCRRAVVRTVEELAGASEPVLERIGMGARELQRKARVYLETAANVGMHTERIEALGLELEAVRRQLADARETVAELREQLERIESRPAKRGPGRPRKDANEPPVDN